MIRAPKGKLLALLIGAAVLATALLVGLLVVLILWWTADARELTHRFLGSVRIARYDLAYELTSRQLRATVPPAAFQAYVDGRAPNVRRSTSDWINGGSEGFSTQCVEAWLSGPGLDSDEVYLLLVKEDEVWRVTDVTAVEPAECEASP